MAAAAEEAPGATNIATIANVYECNLTYSRKRMSALWNKGARMMDKTQRKYLKDIYDAKKGKYCTQEMMSTPIIYRISTTNEMGRLGYGRYYSSPAGAECLECIIRGTLLRDTHTDIDIKNCHPCLIYQYAQNKFGFHMRHLEFYAKNTDRVRAQLMADTGLTKQQIKDMFIITLYNGIPDTLSHTPLEINGMASHKILEDIATEMKAFTVLVKNSGEHTALWEALGRLKKKNRDGSFISYVIQREERHVAEAMLVFMDTKQVKVDALAYDGFAVRGAVEDTLLREAEAHVKATLNYEIVLERKPWECIPDRELFDEGESEQYVALRTEFEKTHAYYRSGNSIVELSDRGFFNFALDHARVAFNTLRLDDEKQPLFIQNWMNDPHRRIVDSLVLKPIEETDPSEFNLFRGYAYKRLQVDVSPEDRERHITFFNNLLRAICGDEDASFQYVLRFFASLISRPFGDPIGVAIIFVSYQQGTGKDTLMKIIRSLVGDAHTAHHNGTTFWEKHDTSSDAAFLEYVEDAPRDFITKANLGLFKNMITGEVRKFNPKNKPGYSVQNRCHTVITTNETALLNLEDSDRRIFPIVSSTRMMNEDWVAVYRLIKEPAFLQSIGEYLESISLDNWNPRRIPDTEFRREVIELSKTSESRFLESINRLDPIEMKTLFPMYQAFCTEHGIPACLNSISLGKKLLPYIGSLIQKRTDHRGVNWYSK